MLATTHGHLAQALDAAKPKAEAAIESRRGARGGETEARGRDRGRTRLTFFRVLSHLSAK